MIQASIRRRSTPRVKDDLNVVFSVDDKYAMLAGVAIRSLVAEFAKSSKRAQYSLQIYIIALDLTNENRSNLISCASSDLVESRIIFIDHQLDRAKEGRDRFVEIITLSYQYPELLPDIDRVIAFDADVMIMTDISELWEMDLGDCWLASVPCLISNDSVSLKNYNYSCKVTFSTAAPPINSGVLLMDLMAMRRDRVTETLQRWTRENFGKTFLTNQEAIALSFPGQWKPLPHEWNYRLMAEPYWTSPWLAYQPYVSLRPKIVHFQLGLRPSELLADFPYFDKWLAHISLTPWAFSLKRKRMPLHLFLYCDYFRCVTALNGVIRSPVMKVVGAGLLTMPFCVLRYVRYLTKPVAFRFRIHKHIATAITGA